MKNVLCIILSPGDDPHAMFLKTFDPSLNKYVWSLPNQKFHADVTLPLSSGQQGCKKLFEMFTFGLFKKDFRIDKFIKYLLPSKSLVYSYTCPDEEYIKIPGIFDSLSKNLLKLDIKKIEFHKIKDLLNVDACGIYHHESIEAIRFFCDTKNI
jgi:hypothetical protein